MAKCRPDKASGASPERFRNPPNGNSVRTLAGAESKWVPKEVHRTPV